MLTRKPVNNSSAAAITLAERVYTVLSAVPYGRVITYGQLASLAGSPHAARQIGRILSLLPAGSSLPWYRVINHQGRISLTGERFLWQLELLKGEGISFDKTGKINLSCYKWLS